MPGPTQRRPILFPETGLARGQCGTRWQNRDPVKRYNRFEMAALPTLAPGFDWPAWLAASGLAGKTSDIIVSQPSYLSTLTAQLVAMPSTVKA